MQAKRLQRARNRLAAVYAENGVNEMKFGHQRLTARRVDFHPLPAKRLRAD